MHPAVVTTVLLLVGMLNTVTADFRTDELKSTCNNVFRRKDCGDGWSFIDPYRCIKYFQMRKNFADAQEYCHTLESELVSIHHSSQLTEVICTTLRGNLERQSFWIGAKRSRDGFTNLDGSEFNFSEWYKDQPENLEGEEACIEVNHRDWGWCIDDNCSKENNFMCAKTMM